MKKVLFVLIAMIYLISPIDLVSGSPIDDVIVLILLFSAMFDDSDDEFEIF